MKTKLKGFTIIELIVSMIISSLIIAMAWNIYAFIKSYNVGLDQKVQSTLAIKRLQYQFVSDAEQALEWRTDKGQILLLANTDTITYFFNDTLTTRSSRNEINTFTLGSRITSRENQIKICILEMDTFQQCLNVNKEPSSLSIIKSR